MSIRKKKRKGDFKGRKKEIMTTHTVSDDWVSDIDVDALLVGNFFGNDETLTLPKNLSGVDLAGMDIDESKMKVEPFRIKVEPQIKVEPDVEALPYQDRKAGQKCKREVMSPGSPMSCSSTDTGRPLKFEGVTGGGDAAPVGALAGDISLLVVPGSQDPKSVMRFVTQPPLEVRTRTKNENRTFSCSVVVSAESPDTSPLMASVELCYATDVSTTIPTMGGSLCKPVEKGTVRFEDLSVSVASPKHNEKEFVLKVTLSHDGQDCGFPATYSTPFYAYSHKSVLKRRREVELRACSHSSVSVGDDCKMHVVGAPFVRSDRLQAVFRVRREDCSDEVIEAIRATYPVNVRDDEAWLSVRAEELECFSESVLFFRPPSVLESLSKDVQAFLQVTNDGRNFSNSLPVEFSVNSVPRAKRHCGAIRSRI